MYNVKCTVKSIKGDCAAGYEIGDHFFIKDMAMIEAGKPSQTYLKFASTLNQR